MRDTIPQFFTSWLDSESVASGPSTTQPWLVFVLRTTRGESALHSKQPVCAIFGAHQRSTGRTCYNSLLVLRNTVAGDKENFGGSSHKTCRWKPWLDAVLFSTDHRLFIKKRQRFWKHESVWHLFQKHVHWTDLCTSLPIRVPPPPHAQNFVAPSQFWASDSRTFPESEVWTPFACM